jgi:hypothetical protein
MVREPPDMTDNKTAADLLLSHYERVTGCQAQFTEVSPRGSKPGLFAAIHRGFPRSNGITGFTVGLSHVHSPVTEGHAHRELVIAMTDDDPAWACAVAFVAYQLRGKCGFDHGDAINFREQIASKSRMAAFLVVRPTLLGIADSNIDLGARTIALRQLVPLYESERAWLMSGGDEASFLQRFSQDELMDPRRPEFQG